jgi:hypothetical protein
LKSANFVNLKFVHILKEAVVVHTLYITPNKTDVFAIDN